MSLHDTHLPPKLALCIALFRQQAEDMVHRLELAHIRDECISIVFPEKGALDLPGIGPYIAVGPIVSALSGDFCEQQASGDIASGLMGLGVAKDKALRYQRKIEGGHYLLAVHASFEMEIELTRRIFEDLGGQDVSILEIASSARSASEV